MGRTLQPDDRISRYRVIGPLGAGGMGEVYIAQDETLERSVALKILPPHLVRNEERLRRFVTEAKSASSLNHPNIVTIHEIGQDIVKPGASSPHTGTRWEAAGVAGGSAQLATPPQPNEAASSPVHFISMELVTGETLTQKIHHEKSDVKTLLGWLAQAAEGVAKAHAAGIVHRDLKPGNIMVSKDGFAKVLDFGLAKLTEKQEASAAEMTSAPTEMSGRTGGGTILGTVGYMSPEQVQGKSADHRSDIFSMGCILYEATTRRRPFVADTDVEVMHQILRERPAPIEELNPEVPAEVRRLIRRCLAKNPDQRFQSMRDLAIEVREIVEEYESLSPSATSAGTLTSGALGAPPARRKGLAASIAAVAVVGLAGLAVGLYGILGERGGDSAPVGGLQDMKISVLLSHDKLDQAVLSGDGRYLAYTTTGAGMNTLQVRQVRTGSDVEILPSQEIPILGVSFSPDGDYLYYLNQDPESQLYRALFQVPSMGGRPRKVAFDVDSAVTFSPDGRHICFKRGLPDLKADSLVVAVLETGEERELIRINDPERFASPGRDDVPAPAWSPDGEHIAATIRTFQGGLRTRLVLIDPESGAAERHGEKTWQSVNSVAWLPDGSEIILSASEIGTQGAQIYRVSYPRGEVYRMTNDLNGYTGITLSSDGTSIAALRSSSVANLWIAPLTGGGEAKPVTSASSAADSILSFEPMADGSIAYTAMKEGRIYLWAMEPDGSGRRQLTSQGVFVRSMGYAPEAGLLFTQVEEGATFHVWRVDPDGGNSRQLTDGHGERLLSVTPDGSRALYTRAERPSVLWSLSLPSGESKIITPDLGGNFSLFSQDGSLLFYVVLKEIEGKVQPSYVIASADGGEEVASLLLPSLATDAEWAPNGRALTYVDQGMGWNVFRMPVEEGEPAALTRFSEGRVLHHEWSPDGAWLSMIRALDDKRSLWIQEARGGDPVLLAEFRSGMIGVQRWARDSASVILHHVITSQDVVIIRDFQ